jgi:quercetin dioxygenase-like cupin family protein
MVFMAMMLRSCARFWQSTVWCVPPCGTPSAQAVARASAPGGSIAAARSGDRNDENSQLSGDGVLVFLTPMKEETETPTTSRAFNWAELPKELVRRGVERAGFRGDNVICVLNWLTPGMEVRPHSHPFEQLVLILQGQVRIHVGDSHVDLGPQGILRIPPNEVHYAEPLGDEVVLNLDIFSPIREDYLHLVDYQGAEFTPANGATQSLPR